MEFFARRRNEQRLMVAADAGDVEAAIEIATDLISMPGSRRARATSSVWAGVGVAGAVLGHPEPSMHDVRQAHLRVAQAIDALPAIDGDLRKSLSLSLAAQQVHVLVLLHQYDEIPAAMANVRSSWNSLWSSPLFLQAMNLVPGGATVLVGTFIGSAWALVTALRVADASELLGMSAAYVRRSDDLKLNYLTAIQRALLAALRGDIDVARDRSEDAQHLYSERSRFLTPIPKRTDALLRASLAWIDASVALAKNDETAAIMRLRRERASLASLESESRPAVLMSLGRELSLLVESGRQAEARSVVAETDAVALLRGEAGGLLAGPLTRILPPDEAVELVRQVVDAEWAFPESLIFPHLAHMATISAAAGDVDAVFACVGQAVISATHLVGGSQSAVERTRIQANASEVRDGLMSALSDVQHDQRSIDAALTLAEVWREQTLRLLLVQGSQYLSRRARDLLTALDVTIRARVEGLHDSSVDNSTLTYLRTAVANEVSAGYAALATPASLNPEWSTLPAFQICISATVVHQGTSTATIVAVISIPGGVATLRFSPFTEQIQTVVDCLVRGFDPVVGSQVDIFNSQWQVARDALGYALGIDLVESSSRSDNTPVRFVLDGPLRQIPVAALRSSRRKYAGPDLPVTHAPFVQRRLASTKGSNPARSVLAFGFDEATMELDHLREMALIDRLDVTVAAELAQIPELLEEGSYDALVISAHGAGRGLEYRLRGREDATSLYVHSLIGLKIPPMVVVAACYSGTEGEGDITGLLATLFAHGASEVLSSLWAVPSAATSMILRAVYEQLDEPTNLAEKLMGAQKEFISSNPGWSGPYWWAGLVVSSV